MKERLSSLMDNALDDAAVVNVLDGIKRDRAAMRDWDTYHLIGDSLRADSDLHAGIASRVMAQLESEPTVLAPMQGRAMSAARMRWALPLAASVMGVGAVAWVAQSLNAPSRNEVFVQTVVPASQIAANAPKALVEPVSATVAIAPVAAPAQVTFAREYLIAHQAYSPAANMSGVAPYVRTVSESRVETGR